MYNTLTILLYATFIHEIMKNGKANLLPKITFIVPTLNAEAFLPSCLSSIRNQNYPQKQIEIIIADGGSTDKTKLIAHNYSAKILPNKRIYQEYGKTEASKKAKGSLLFYVDADNVLSTKNFVASVVSVYLKHPEVMGFLPQTIPAPDSNPIDRYLGYLFTDPFTWFIYKNSANPKDFHKAYKPLYSSSEYELYRFPKHRIPLFGLAQGVATNRQFIRGTFDYADDILSGIKLIRQGGIVAYIPKATLYHYHIKNYGQFIQKYRWRVQNNFSKNIKDTGLVSRLSYLSSMQKFRIVLFLPYALSIVFPLIDSLLLTVRYRDKVMLYHLIISYTLAWIIIIERIRNLFCPKPRIGHYR
ncbi:MAG: glycosyltransferase [Candidatus Paceibacterota bacterium]